MTNIKQAATTAAQYAVLAGAIAAGVTASELSGFTKAATDLNYGLCQRWHEAHKRYPLVVWGDYGDPNQNPEWKKFKYRIATDIEMGVLSLMAVGLGTLALDDFREKRSKRKLSPVNIYDSRDPNTSMKDFNSKFSRRQR